MLAAATSCMLSCGSGQGGELPQGVGAGPSAPPGGSGGTTGGTGATGGVGTGATSATGGTGGTPEPAPNNNYGPIVQLEAGLGGGFCMRREGGTVRCWANIASPRSSLAFVDVAVGFDHACGVGEDERAYCWGNAFDGALGNSRSGFSETDVPLVVETEPDVPLEDVRDVEAGSEMSCAILGDDSVWCWGNNSRGHLDASSPDDMWRTARKTTDGVNIDRLYMRSTRICGVQHGGEMICWGSSGGAGQDTLVANTTDFQMGSTHACAFVGSQFLCWGTNDDGELGHPRALDPPTHTCHSGNSSLSVPCNPIPLPPDSVTGVRDFSLGSSFTCAVDEQRDVWCWGLNSDGRLGIRNTTFKSYEPIKVPEIANAAMIASTSSKSCAVICEGSVECWGQDTAFGFDASIFVGPACQ